MFRDKLLPKRTRILFLYSEVMGYTLAVLNSFVKDHNCEVFVMYWDEDAKKNSSFQLKEAAYPINFFKRSHYDEKNIELLINQIDPHLICVSGWMDKLYLKACNFAKKKNTPVVCLMDTQWRNTFRQKVAIALSSFFHKRYFNYMWVAGLYQYEYARKLGYSRNKIITGMYTADTEKFNNYYHLAINGKKEHFPHVFLYVGRFIGRKGIDDLVTAYQNTLNIKNHDWKLIVIGDGVLKEELKKNEMIIVKDFVQPDKLITEIEGAGVFCLPSRFEAWGVVIHEFACAGLPIISSDECGAATEFVKNGYNGYTYPSGDIKSLTKRMLAIINTPDDVLRIMGERSHQLSMHLSPLINSSAILDLIQE